MPICGFIQFDMSAFCLFVVLCNLICLLFVYLWFYAICYVCFLPICGFMQLALIFHVEPVVLFNFLVLCFEKDLTLKFIQF
ncbi:hypothetical protein BY996DRAFT_2529321 [Phakopsora pachyrhizi]|nr:hypothetical protein BY996DRAFT_2529321 [Phakopsora pachyrhizi]